MKKQYTTPEMRIIDVIPSDIICTSPTVTFDNSGDELDTGGMY